MKPRHLLTILALSPQASSLHDAVNYPVKGGQPHVHFDNNAALNKDGTWKEGYYELNNSQIDYLRQNG